MSWRQARVDLSDFVGRTDLVLRFPYFETEEPIEWVEDTTYAGEGTLENPRQFEWNHGIGEIVTAVLDAGMEIRALREHRSLEWQGLPSMTLSDDGRWRLPPEQADLAPLMFTLVATKPGPGAVSGEGNGPAARG